MIRAVPEPARRVRHAPRSAVVSGALALALLLAAGAPAAAPEDGLGRLFTTPEQRKELDEARRASHLGIAEPEAPPIQSAEVPVVNQLSVNGMVLRSSGVNSSWINGAQIGSGQITREGIRVEAGGGAGGRVRLVLPGGLDAVSLKPGQKMDVVEGAVVDAYQRLPVKPEVEVKGMDEAGSDPEDAPR